MALPAWLKTAVFYEIYPQSFYDSNADGIGDLEGIIQKLDYVKGLGCNALWINPCFESPFMDAGYDVSDYKKIAPRYGTNEDAKRLFEEAHQRGMKVLFDLVPGHTSDRHPWFLRSKEAEENEYSARYVWTPNVFVYPEHYRWVSGVCDRDGNYMVNFFSSQPALNYGFEQRTEPWQLPPEHPAARATLEAMKDVMRFWMDMGCDGFRVDMAASLVKNDPERTGIKRLWRNVREMFDKDYPENVLLSEWGIPEQSIDAGFHLDFYLHFDSLGYNALFREGYECTDGLTCFFSEAGKGDITVFTEEYARRRAAAAGRGYICLPTGNHDMVRLACRRTMQERKVAEAFILLMPTIPFLYYGDEIGLPYREGLVSKEGGYFRTGSRTPMQWTSGKNRGFSETDGELYLPVDEGEASPDVASQEKDDHSILNMVRKLLALRREHEELQAGENFEVLYAEKGRYPFVFRRGSFVVAVNPSGREEEAPLAGAYETVFSVGGAAKTGNGAVKVPPVSLTLLRTK